MNKEDLLNLIELGEGQKLEFKESFSSSDIRKEIKYTICAFANTEGGKILIGVCDDGKIKGIKITNDILSQAQQLGRQIDPHLKLIVNNIENVMIIEVFENDDVHSVNGMYFMRYGTETQKLTTGEVRGLFELKNKILFEEKENSKFDFDSDFNKNAFNNFLQLSKINSKINIKQILENIGLIKNGFMNNAGVLFFCNDVYKFFKNATVQVFLYKGNSESSILDSKEFILDLFSNFKSVYDYLKQKLNTEAVIEGVFRKDILEIPEVALREALLNAFSHRDYTSNFNIQVHIYFDRVEIINSGGLVNELKIEDLGIKRFPRNILICDMFQRMDLVEKAGSGIKRIRDLIKEKGLKEPTFEADKHFFKLTFWRKITTDSNKSLVQIKNDPKNDPKRFSKKERKELILEKLKENNKDISYYLLLEEFGVDRSTIKRDLKELKEEGLIEFVGDKRTGVWKIINK